MVARKEINPRLYDKLYWQDSGKFNSFIQSRTWTFYFLLANVSASTFSTMTKSAYNYILLSVQISKVSQMAGCWAKPLPVTFLDLSIQWSQPVSIELPLESTLLCAIQHWLSVAEPRTILQQRALCWGGFCGCWNAATTRDWPIHCYDATTSPAHRIPTIIHENLFVILLRCILIRI